jgi:membrane protein YqaA with SNARE-associated domain
VLTRLYNWTMAQAAGPRAVPALFAVSFMESSFFPIPPDVMLVPMCLADRKRAFYFGFVCTVASVLGGAFGYAIGYFLYDTIGRVIVDFYGMEDAFERFQAMYAEWGLWIILIKGLTPIPYKVITIASGVAEFNFWVFMVASFATRGLRFLIEAALLWRFGPPIRAFIERRLGPLTWAFFIALVGGFVAVRYLL